MSRGFLVFCFAALCAMEIGALDRMGRVAHDQNFTAADRAHMTDMALLGSAADGTGGIPENYEPLSAGAVPPEFQGNYDASTGIYTDPSTGLSALLVKNTDTGEVAVAFGGDDLPPPNRLAAQSARASALVAGVMKAAGDSKINVTGNNPLGGGLARYAMLENSDGIDSKYLYRVHDRIEGFGFNMGELSEFEAFLAVFQTPSLAEATGKLWGRGMHLFNQYNSDGDLLELVNRIRDLSNRFGDEYGSVAFVEDEDNFWYGRWWFGGYGHGDMDMDVLDDAMLGALDRQESLQDELDRIKNDWGDWDDDLTGGGTAPGGSWTNNDLVDLANTDPLGDLPGGEKTPLSKIDELISKNFRATYNGNVIAQLYTQSNIGGAFGFDTPVGEQRNGGFAMEVDFGTKAYSAVIGIPDVEHWGDVEVRTNGTLDSMRQPHNYPGQFVGENVNGAGITSSNNTKFGGGFMHGKFYGPEAEGVGGGFRISEEGLEHALGGYFAGQR